MERILAFGCHPDDAEFFATGTLALLAGRGYEVHIATMAGGQVGHPAMRPEEIREKRLTESAASAAVLGGQYHFAGGYDLEVEYNSAYRKLAVRVMRQVDPLIVLAPPPTDYLIDHEETSRLVRNAAYIASVPNYDCGEPVKPTERFPYVYYWNALALTDIFGRPLPLSCAVNTASVIDTKVKMLACHESQREWLRFHNGWDAYIENMLADSAAVGKLIGAEHGEGFIQHRGAGHPADNILKQILGELCVEL